MGHVFAAGWNYEFESDTGHGGGGPEISRPPGWHVTASDVPRRVGLFHNCGLDWGGGGTSDDREPLSPAPPPRALSVERDLLESD